MAVHELFTALSVHYKFIGSQIHGVTRSGQLSGVTQYYRQMTLCTLLHVLDITWSVALRAYCLVVQ